jgi:hypothetical protein
MTLQSPKVDERTFEQLVNDARLHIQKSCQEWTDLSPHDPGMVLIEALAHMTESLIFRLNRVPDSVYIELLKLIGVRLLPPSAAEVTLTFTLSKPSDQPVTIPAKTTVGAGRQQQGGESVSFVTGRAIAIPSGQSNAKGVAYNAELIEGELAGAGTGQPGLAVRVKRPPIIAPSSQRKGEPMMRSMFDLEVGVEVQADEAEDRERIRVHGGKRFQLWEERETFAGAGPRDRVYTVDRAAGLIVFSPAVSLPDSSASEGTLAQWVAPPAGREIRVWYARGGGVSGNVKPGTQWSIGSPMPSGVNVTVTNDQPATGGRSAETLANALIRGPRELHALRRAVTAADFELLATSSGSVARARAYTEADVWVHGEPGVVGVALVPALPDAVRGEADENVRRDLLSQFETDSARETVAAKLEERRPLGTRCHVMWVRYKPVGIAARVVVRRGEDPVRVRHDALARINRLLSPLSWPFQRPLRASQIYETLLADPAVSYASSVALAESDDINSVDSLAADSFQPATFFVGSGATLFRSTNNGGGWEPIRTFPGSTVYKVASHPERPGLLAALTRTGGNARSGVVYRSQTCGETWDSDVASMDGLEDVAWKGREEGAPELLLAGDKGLHNWPVGKSPLEVGLGSGLSLQLCAVAVARHARGDVSVAVAANGQRGVFLSRQGGRDGSFEATGLVGEEVRVLAVQQRSDGRSFLWAGTWSIGEAPGKGFYRCELLGAERKPEPWQAIEGWEGASALCAAFLGDRVLAGTFKGGVLWTETMQDKPRWSHPDLRSGLPLREQNRLFHPVRGLAVSPFPRAEARHGPKSNWPAIILAGGPGGMVCGEEPDHYVARSAESTEEVALAPNWLFCAGTHRVEVLNEEDIGGGPPGGRMTGVVR